MKTLFSLLQLSREQLLELADSHIPASLTSRVEVDALPPSFVAKRSLELVSEGKPEFWCNTFLNTSTHVDEDNDIVVQWVWKNDL